MSTDQLMYQMDLPSHQNEWYDFDAFFEFPAGDMDSNSTSVNSISPKDLDLSYSEADASNWNPSLGAYTQASFPELVDYENQLTEYTLGTEPIANPNETLQLPSSSEADGFVGSTYDATWSPDFPGHDDQFYSTIRQMVESQAATDAGYSSKKEKRIEASIALHMQRLQDVSLPDIELFSDSNTSFPSPCWSETARPNASLDGSPATTLLSEPTSKSSTPSLSSDAAGGGMELVLDLNMNTAANVPKKQKPRSRAQKENYIKVRKHGACEKHRKQHKRCNCLETTISRVDMAGTLLPTANEVTRPTVYAQQLRVRGQDHDRLLLQTKLRQSSAQPSAQSSSLADRNVPRPVVSSPESSTTLHSSCHAERPVHSSDPGRTLQVRSLAKETRPRRGVDQIPSSTGQLATPTVQESPTANLSQRTSNVQTNRLRPSSNRGSPELRTVIHGHDHDQLLSQGLLQRWRSRPTTKTGQESVQQTVQCTPGSNASDRNGLVVQRRLPVLSACAGLFNAALAFSQFWQQSASVTSWAGNLVERFLVVSSRQFWHVRKGWGLN